MRTLQCVAGVLLNIFRRWLFCKEVFLIWIKQKDSHKNHFTETDISVRFAESLKFFATLCLRFRTTIRWHGNARAAVVRCFETRCSPAERRLPHHGCPIDSGCPIDPDPMWLARRIDVSLIQFLCLCPSCWGAQRLTSSWWRRYPGTCSGRDKRRLYDWS